jgi:thiol-disulfide isomerase/thioredoxin
MNRLKKAALAVTVLIAALAVLGFALYASNVAPTVPAIAAEAAAKSGKPYVIKLHAQWCAACMVTKGVWSQIEQAYGPRVNLVVLDFTNDANTKASQAEASRLGLQKFYDEFSGATGQIVVVDGRTKEVRATIAGSRDFAEYRTAIEAALNEAPSR